MTMDEVNERFPLSKYKAWRSSRADEGLPTAGGIAAPASRPQSIKGVATIDEAEPSATTSGPASENNTAERAEEGRATVSHPPSQRASLEKPSGKEGVDKEEALKRQSQESSTSGPKAGDVSETAPQLQNVGTNTTTLAEEKEDGMPNAADELEEDDPIRTAIPTELANHPGDSCAICLDLIEDEDDIRGLTCGHAFHASCVDPWLTSRRACCPLCKADYYVPKPRAEGDAATEAERMHRRQAGLGGSNMNLPAPPQYAFMGSRPRMVLPGRFMSVAYTQDTDRYGFPRVVREPRGPRGDGATSGDPATTTTSREQDVLNRPRWMNSVPRVPQFSMPSLSFPTRFGGRGGAATQSAAAAASPNPESTPSQLEAGRT